MKKGLTASIIITFIANLDSVISFISRIFNILNLNDMDWIIHTISIIGVFAVVFYLLSKYERVKDEMVANNILGQIRNEYFFLQEFKNWEFYKSPNETNEQFFKRLPQSKYVDYLKDEYMTAREALINKLDIKPSEAESILDSLYGFELKKSKKKDEPNRDKQQISK